MAKLDLVLFLTFTTISFLALLFAIWCFMKALRIANAKDGDVKMFLWSLGTMLGLIVSGMSAAYILLPIFLHY